jgi:hypothetical protein
MVIAEFDVKYTIKSYFFIGLFLALMEEKSHGALFASIHGTVCFRDLAKLDLLMAGSILSLSQFLILPQLPQ